jgi:hypothetical protein
MPSASESESGTRAGRALLAGLALLLAAWGANLAGWYRVRHLDLSGFGRCEDVPEALARDCYVAGQFWPYISAAAALDGAAIIVLACAGARGRGCVLGLALGLVALLSLGWHGLLWVASSVFPL